MNARHFRTFARYNAWANARLYAACGALSEAAYLAERPVFFGSIHRTLNHVLVGDRLWLGRITGVPAGIPTLDTELFPDRDALRAAREAEDARIIGLVDGYDDARLLAAEVVYANMSGAEHRDPLRLVLAHFFNHQTHHRGQVHDMLSATDVAPPPLDLIYYLREVGEAD
ncbi:MAG: damage-inducible protein DinB [Rhodospirillaceae bacterium]|nr:damage-inducible protein DinB [Rhodospirillaceae bacterium]